MKITKLEEKVVTVADEFFSLAPKYRTKKRLNSLLETERKEAVGGFVKDAWDILEDIPHSEIMKDEAGNNIEITYTLEYRYQLALEQYLTQTKGGKE